MRAAAFGAALGALAPPAARSADANLERIIEDNRRYIVERQLADGALPDTRDLINPYFANLAISGLLELPSQGAIARKWFNWYLGHLNHGRANRWELDATIYVYDLAHGVERSRGTASNADANPATLLSAMLAFYRTGDAADRAFIDQRQATLAALAQLMDTLADHDLTWDKPDYRVKYLIDNCQVFRGYLDYGRLLELAGDGAGAARISARAEATRQAINTQLWNEADRSYYYDLAESGKPAAVNWNRWYRENGAVSQLFPILYGVVEPADPRAIDLYDRFNRSFPDWPELVKPDEEFAWTSVSYAAMKMGDPARARRFVEAVDRRIGAAGYRWPWHIEESGWLLRTAVALRRSGG